MRLGKESQKQQVGTEYYVCRMKSTCPLRAKVGIPEQTSKEGWEVYSLKTKIKTIKMRKLVWTKQYTKHTD